MDAHATAIAKAAGSALVDALRSAVEESTRRYEQQTGSVVTRIETYRLGSDWCIDVVVLGDAPTGMSDDKFI